MKEIMMIEKKIKKYVVVIICVLSMITLGKKTENIFASDKKSKDMENILLSFYIKMYQMSKALNIFHWIKK